jgi:transposase
MTGVTELTMTDIEQLLARARNAPINEDDDKIIRAMAETLFYLRELASDNETTIQQLRQILSRPGSEKMRDLFEKLNLEPKPAAKPPENGAPTDKKPGHGRNGAKAYTGAKKVRVRHPSLETGQRCPECDKGRLYGQIQPATLIRIVGQAPIQATVYELEKLRCNLCGEVFTAAAPEDVGSEKYDATSAIMVALLKYGSGLPFHRLERLQSSLGIPLPASTQWDIVSEAADRIEAAHEELIRQAAAGEVLYNDDTSMKILELMKQGAHDDDFPDRTGIFTSGIVSTHEGRRIALFFTGRKHAGENLSKVLAERAKALGPPIQMCDALSRNVPKELEVILANCIVHGRRRFVEIAANFPEECRHVLEILGQVYKNDAIAREQAMSPEDRLGFHQARSGPLMTQLHEWFAQQLKERKVEPNSGLGSAFAYMNNHWHALTLFLRQAGAPLDNNICERALKKVILHRKNALFYKTQNGAHVGDIFMSLISTCQLVGSDPFDYLTALHRNSPELSRNPQQWMPWNYRETLALHASV